ncbi:helicase associated domain-containing protein [Streptomyces phaeoluteigriseus]
MKAQQLGFDKLSTVQQWMCEHILGIQPATPDDKPEPRTSQADKWALHLTAARQYHQREGHLKVPRKNAAREAGTSAVLPQSARLRESA